MMDDFSRSICGDISLSNIYSTLEYFNHLHRLSGSADGESSVDYILDKLNEYHIPCERLTYEGFFSRPVSAVIKVLSPVSMEISAIAACYSKQVQGLRAYLHFDENGASVIHGQANVVQKTHNDLYENAKGFANKIVLSSDSSLTFNMRAKEAGAVGKIHIWPSDEPVQHHTSITASWGIPTPETRCLLNNNFPAVSICKKDGDALIDLCRKGDVLVEMNIEMDTGVYQSSMPIANIPGKSDQYILIAGHYDSWYEGMTDNAAGNAIMLELARVLSKYSGSIERGVRIAWWSGHSDGHYMGSTWYADNYWKDINQNCVAYLYLDILGGKNTHRMLPRGSLLEGRELQASIIEELTGVSPREYIPITKTGDMSFWGPSIPFIFYVKNEPSPENRGDFSGLGGGYWWHTKDDTIDKIDPDILLRDAKFYGAISAIMTSSPRLPFHLTDFIGEMKGYLCRLNENSTDEFDLSAEISDMDLLCEYAAKLESALCHKSDAEYNKAMLSISREVTRLVYSTVDPYSIESGIFPGSSLPFAAMHAVSGLTRENAPAEVFLFAKTSFVRQCNRLHGEIDHIIQMICQHLNK